MPVSRAVSLGILKNGVKLNIMLKCRALLKSAKSLIDQLFCCREALGQRTHRHHVEKWFTKTLKHLMVWNAQSLRWNLWNLIFSVHVLPGQFQWPTDFRGKGFSCIRVKPCATALDQGTKSFWSLLAMCHGSFLGSEFLQTQNFARTKF